MLQKKRVQFPTADCQWPKYKARIGPLYHFQHHDAHRHGKQISWQTTCQQGKIYLNALTNLSQSTNLKQSI